MLTLAYLPATNLISRLEQLSTARNLLFARRTTTSTITTQQMSAPSLLSNPSAIKQQSLTRSSSSSSRIHSNSVVSSSSSNNTTSSFSASPTFLERRTFPHLASFTRGKPNNSGPNGAPVIRTNHGSLVFPAKRAGSTTWLKRYRKTPATTGLPHMNGKRRSRNHTHEFDPRLLSSSMNEVRTLADFRHDVLFKPQRAVHLRSQIKVQNKDRRIREEKEDARLANAVDEEDLSDFELLKVTLRDIRLHVEKLKQSDALDLRSFLGANLDVTEFQRLFRTQIGVKLEGRKLNVVMSHFDKDGDGTLDYIEIHSQLMNPHRLHVSDAEATHDDMLQTALNKVREKVMEKQKAKIAAGTAKEEDLVNAKTGGKKGRGPDLKSIFKHFDTDNSGIIAREEFVEAMIKLGVEMNRYELNKLYWTLDPDRSGTISYAEFSGMFFNRRAKMQAEKKKKMKGLLKPHWRTTGRLEAQEEISKDRQHMYTGINTPYKQEVKVEWEHDQNNRKKILYGLWKADQGGHHAKLLVNTRSFLNAPAEEAIDQEKSYILERSSIAKKRFLDRHDSNVIKHTKAMREKALLPPEVVVPKFGKWNVGGEIPIVMDNEIDELNLDTLGYHNRKEDDEQEEEEEYDLDSMAGFRLAPEDWDMEDVKKVVAKARE